MKNIKTVNISSVEYKIILKHGLKDDKLGECDGITDTDEKTIELDDNLNGAAFKKAFLHEIIECMNEEYSLRLHHTQICALEGAIYDTFCRNNLNGLFRRK